MPIDYNRIKELVNKYKEIMKNGEYETYSEEDTKNIFLTPLFKALGWNTERRGKSNDYVSYEENIAGKRSDYGFYIDNIPKMFVEAKSIKTENLPLKDLYIKQAVGYAWGMACSWAVLSNFSTTIVYNADSGLPEWFFTLHPEDFLEDPKHRLEWLSKEEMEKAKIDEEALSVGKKSPEIPVGKQLLSDLINFRKILSSDIKKNYKELTQENIDEIVQRILDRLIFIKSAEDRQLEPKTLEKNYRQWSVKEKGYLIKKIREVFNDYKEHYNSGLFGESNKESKDRELKNETEISDEVKILNEFADKVEISNEALIKVIGGLCAPEGGYLYNFASIKADVLGSMYEQYLGNILKTTPKRARLSESKTHRKEQGIYYTPSYIVDYIVKNTVGEYIKTHTPEEIRNVKILDPACGSGSFLIKAYKMLEDYWSKEGEIHHNVLDADATEDNEFYSMKMHILKENIFGIDLDPKAVEITILNLMLQSSEKGKRLPILQNNIIVGNSIVDTETMNKNGFDWKEKFPQVMDKGGFDIIIGNPPYIKEYTNREVFEPVKKSSLSKYYMGKMDYWYFFACQAIDKLKDGGFHSFIAQDNWITSYGASKLRDKILKESKIISFLDFCTFKVFENADIQTMIYVLKKEKPTDHYYLKYFKVKNAVLLEKNKNKLLKILNHSDIIDFSNIKFEPYKYVGTEITFTMNAPNKILAHLEKERNYTLKASDISTGIDVHQEYVIESHLPKLDDKTIKKGDGIFVISKDELNNLGLTTEEMKLIRPYYTTSELFRYYGLRDNKNFIIYTKSDINKYIDNYPNIKRHFDKFKSIITSDFKPYGLHRSRKEEFFEDEKIISLRKTDKPYFTYTDFPCYVSQTFFVIKPRDVDLKLLTAILNSKVIYFWLKNKGKRQGALLQIDKAPLLSIPIRIPTDVKLKEEIVRRVNKIIDIYEDFRNSKQESQRAKFKDMVADEERKIDSLIYKVYELSPDQIKFIEEF